MERDRGAVITWVEFVAETDGDVRTQPQTNDYGGAGGRHNCWCCGYRGTQRFCVWLSKQGSWERDVERGLKRTVLFVELVLIAQVDVVEKTDLRSCVT